MSSATSRSQFRIVIVEDHVLFAESLELALTVEGYDVRRVPIPDKRAVAGRPDRHGAAAPPPGGARSTSTSDSSATASS